MDGVELNQNLGMVSTSLVMDNPICSAMCSIHFHKLIGMTSVHPPGVVDKVYSCGEQLLIVIRHYFSGKELFSIVVDVKTM